MDFKLIGGILLIIGTSIGAGMLALPIATAQLGFFGSLVLLVLAWLVMTTGALLILEVNLWLPHSSNLLSMAKRTLGPIGKAFAWVAFLLLLNSLLCAYIAGGSDLFHDFLADNGLALSRTSATLIVTAILGLVVCGGIRTIDYVNRCFMLVKFGALFLLIFLLMPHVTVTHLQAGSLIEVTSGTAMLVTITSFGFAAIVPSLRVYFNGDVRKLRLAIIIGSLIPLICYALWDAVIMGVLSLDGEHGLIAIMHANSATSLMVDALNNQVHETTVSVFTHLFTSVCMATSFLGVALCLADFWADGLACEKKGMASVLIHVLTFLPSVLVVIFYPNAFVVALQYAGLICVLLMMLMPTVMAWYGRYKRGIATGYRVMGGKPLLVGMALVSIFIIIKGVIS